MNTARRLKLLFLTLTVSASLFAHSPLRAEGERLDISASPPIYNLTSTPGSVVKDRIRIRNNSTATANLKVELRSLTAAGESGEGKIEELDAGSELKKWVSFEQPVFKALPQEYTFIPFSITIPESAAFGYYMAFYISPVASTTTTENGSQVQGAVAIPVLLNVKKPGAKAEAKLDEFKPKAFVSEYLPVEFLTRVTNTGNIHINPRGNIFIRSGGKDIATLTVNPGLGNILPNTTRAFESSWEEGFIIRKPVTENGNVKIGKDGKPETYLEFNWNKLTQFRFGKYTAALVLVYNDGTRDIPVESTTTFWVIPYKALVIIILVILGIILGIRFVIKSYVKKQIQKLKV